MYVDHSLVCLRKVLVITCNLNLRIFPGDIWDLFWGDVSKNYGMYDRQRRFGIQKLRAADGFTVVVS